MLSQKSLISHRGAAEFAKRFVIRDLTTDISPVSIRVMMNSHHTSGAMSAHNQYGCKRLTTISRLLGHGFKGRGRLLTRKTLKVRRLIGLYSRASLPFDLWLGQGLPLNPYG